MTSKLENSTFTTPGRMLVVLVGALLVAMTTAGVTQTQAPQPGPADPPTTESKAGEVIPMPPKPGASDLVINPTTAECERGWVSGMKWSQEEFAQLCAVMKSAK